MKTSILLIRILFVPLIGLLLGECISYSPCQEDAPVGKPLPIDGIWRARITHANTVNNFYYKIEGGRMYLANVSGPDSLFYSDEVGKYFFCNIKFLGKNRYACKIFSIYGKPAINGFLEVVDNQILVTPKSPILIDKLAEVSLKNEDLFSSFHAK